MTYNFSLNVINLVILVYLMIDAPKHGKNQILWGVLGFFFGPITLTVYLFKTKRTGWAYVWLVISVLSIITFLGIAFFLLHMILHLL